MLYVPASREDLMFLMPKGGQVAEIGVARGDFSRRILDAAEPGRLHLIDPWTHQDREDYRNDPSNWSEEEGDALHRSIQVRFAKEVGAGQVAVHRGFSGDVVSRFPDGSLDWIYIDGLHSYEGVKADLDAFAPKIKPDGFILGHDYAKHEEAQAMGFGVVEAVDEFVRTQGWAFLALSAERYPTFFLARNADGATAKGLCLRILFSVPGVSEIRDFPGRSWEQTILTARQGGTVSLIRF
ncbi:MAG: class I SAM-dependent methyltransferase [Magnetospirillum sp. WYHS-4]